jgi:hypothetical protein
VCFAVGGEDRCIDCAIRDKGFDVVHLLPTMSTNKVEKHFHEVGPNLEGSVMDLHRNIPPMLSLITPLLSQGQACNKLSSPLFVLNAFSHNLTPRWLQISRQAHSLIESHHGICISICIYRRVDGIIHSKPISHLLALGQTQIYYSGLRKVAIGGNDFETRESFRRPHVYPLNCRSRILSGQYLDSIEMTLTSWK